MPKEEENSVSTDSSPKKESPLMNETVIAHMLQMSAGKQQYVPTNDQVDKIIALQEKGMDYTHKERTTYLPQNILQVCAFAFTVLVITGIFVFSAFYAKEYLGEIISGVFGLGAGGGIGYGFGSKKSKNTDN